MITRISATKQLVQRFLIILSTRLSLRAKRSNPINIRNHDEIDRHPAKRGTPRNDPSFLSSFGNRSTSV
jgi:hypothetical protein